MKKKLLILVLIVFAAAGYYISHFSPSAELERYLAHELEKRGFTQVELAISALKTKEIIIERLAFNKEKMRIEVNQLTITAENIPYTELLRRNFSNVKAQWRIKTLIISGIPQVLPSLAGEGDIAFANDAPHISGTLADSNHSYAATFHVTPVLATIDRFSAPWQGAKLSAKDIIIALDTPKPIRIPLAIEQLPVATLLSMATSSKATGTGMVSGTVPLTINPDGAFMLGKGELSAGEGGTITVSPEALPGNNPQMEIARTALSNFHYNHLSLALGSGANQKLTMRLNIEGNNPEAFDGRPVKLNVNLSGDLLELLQQTVLPLANPTDYIKDTQ